MSGAIVPAGLIGPVSGERYALTVREQIAAMAMQGLAEHYACAGHDFSAVVAELAVKHADALLLELSKQEAK